MAKLKFGSIITDSRGAIGGQQIKGTRFGPIIMPRTYVTNRHTTAQGLQRALVTNITRNWTSTLTDAERQDWRDLAAANPQTDIWGSTFQLAGIDMFLRLNIRRFLAALSYFTTAPSDQVVTSPLTATLSSVAGPTLTLAWTATPAPTNHHVRIYTARQQSAGTSVATKRYRLTELSSAGAASPLNIKAPYETRFGPLTAGKKIFAQLSFWNSINGAESPRISTFATVA